MIAGEGYVFTFKGGISPICLINVDVCNYIFFHGKAYSRHCRRHFLDLNMAFSKSTLGTIGQIALRISP